MTFKIQIPNEIIKDQNINAMEFVMLGKLIHIYYLSGEELKFGINHKNLIFLLSIGDNNTFKKAFNNLAKQGYILSELDALPRKGEIPVQLNKKVIPKLNKGKAFTQLPKYIYDKSVIDSVGYVGIRLLYYYQSHIGKRNYCFASEETIAADLGITKKTVITYNKKLNKKKFIKIDTHDLLDTGEYRRVGEKDLLTFKKYNNHYYLREDKIKEFATKNIAF